MKLYKYRSANNLERDLNTFGQNNFYASAVNELNDNKELRFNHDKIDDVLDVLRKAYHGSTICDSIENVKKSALDLFNTVNHCGVFSLSDSCTLGNMWALYASNRSGYCLEFDSKLLMQIVSDPINEQRYLFKVNYSREIPNIDISDISKKDQILVKMLATKHENWDKEQEYRIVTDKPGLQPFIPSALTGIVFGTATDEELKKQVVDKFEGRNLDIYRVVNDENSYDYHLSHIGRLQKHLLLNSGDYEYWNTPAPTIDNFYVKSCNVLSTRQDKEIFIRKFKHDVAERGCNIFLMDSDFNFDSARTYADSDFEYIDKHVEAEMWIGGDDVVFGKE